MTRLLLLALLVLGPAALAETYEAIGQIVGNYVAEDGSPHGFLRDDGDDN